jgi:transcriptional regulator with XRE-family HTH domain
MTMGSKRRDMARKRKEAAPSAWGEWMAANPIRERRLDRKWTQQRLALMAGVSLPSIERYEAGAIPKEETAKRLGAALEMPDVLARLLEWKKGMPCLT